MEYNSLVVIRTNTIRLDRDKINWVSFIEILLLDNFDYRAYVCQIER